MPSTRAPGALFNLVWSIPGTVVPGIGQSVRSATSNTFDPTIGTMISLLYKQISGYNLPAGYLFLCTVCSRVHSRRISNVVSLENELAAHRTILRRKHNKHTAVLISKAILPREHVIYPMIKISHHPPGFHSASSVNSRALGYSRIPGTRVLASPQVLGYPPVPGCFTI